MPNNPDSPIPSTEIDAIDVDSTSSGPCYTPGTSLSSAATSPSSSRQNRVEQSDTNDVFSMSKLAEAVDATPNPFNGVASLSPDATRSRSGTPRRKRQARRSSANPDKLPHNVLDEELPDDLFHSPQFQRAFKDAKKYMSRVETVLQSSSLHLSPDSTIHRLHEESKVLAEFDYPSSRTVGFVGDSGVGKSSLLNSLLDTKGLARTSNSGEACTCVVTEYHYHHRDTLDIEVDLFSMDELKEQCTKLLQAYRLFYLNGAQIERSERADAEASAKVSRDTFHAMFRGQLKNDNFLIGPDEDGILTTLTRWARDARPAPLITHQSGLSLSACSKALMELSSEPPARDKPAVWPYIRSIKVFLNAHILSRGLILVDLPGLRDLNAARQFVTERYLLECNEIFAICNIGRAVTDQGVEHVFDLAKRARLSNVGIICTRSEDLQAEEAIKDWRGKGAKTIKKIMHAIDTDKRDERKIQEELDEYDEDDDLSEDEMVYKSTLYTRRDAISARKRSHEFELKEYMVTTRNKFVTMELRAKYGERVTDDIKVFCVSNKYYWDHREEPKQRSLPFLNLSGILQVRKHCISIVANSQRRIAQRYMNDEIPAFLASVSLWVQSGARTGKEEHRAAIVKCLDEEESRLKRALTSKSGVINCVAKLMKEDFKEHVYSKKQISSWSRAASDAADDWAGWHWASYAAFCRNYGDYRTPAVGHRNWNEEVIEEMVKSLESPWEEFGDIVVMRQSEISDAGLEATEKPIERFEDEQDWEGETVETLTDGLAKRQQLFLGSIERANDKFDKGLELLSIDAMSSIRTSYIGRALEPSYRKCNNDSGTGVHGRRTAVMDRAIGNKNLFAQLMKDFQREHAAKAEAYQEAIQKARKKYLKSVHEIFDLVRSENVAKESEQDPEFRRRVEMVMKEGKEMMETIHSVAGVEV